MNFNKTPLAGAYVIELNPIKDARGFFARSWARDEFEKHGLNTNIAQANVAYNHRKGTLRGMHFQYAPDAEAKLVRCTRGAIYDVIIDLRPDSPTRKEWFGVELTAENHLMLYVPEGFAHGYQTLANETEISYMTTALYAPASASGVYYADPAFGIKWPLGVTVISDADTKWTPYKL